MRNNDKFPLYFPGIANSNNESISIIAIDLREGKSKLAHYITKNGNVELQVEKSYGTKDFESAASLISTFIKENALQNIQRLSIGFPGPIINNTAASERIAWKINKDEIQKELNIPEVFLLNDLEASAYGLANVSEDCLVNIYPGNVESKGNMAMLSPGNGLGEAGFYYDGSHLRPFATEGGHTEFSPRTNVEVEFYQFLNKIYGIVSWEQVLSKNGLFNIYRFLRDEKRHPQSEKLTKMFQEGDFVEMLYKAAVEDEDLICTTTINTYLEFLAREANNLVLKLKATGGLFLSGDLAILFKDYIDNDRFYQKFKISDKMEKLLNEIPIYLVVSDKIILNGAALYAGFSKE